MPKIVEYRTLPVTRWFIVRFESEKENGRESGGSEQRGEFPNEEMADEVAALLAKAEDDATFISRKSRNRPVSA